MFVNALSIISPSFYFSASMGIMKTLYLLLFFVPVAYPESVNVKYIINTGYGVNGMVTPSKIYKFLVVFSHSVGYYDFNTLKMFTVFTSYYVVHLFTFPVYYYPILSIIYR
jgi:hypothetical protein